ncbi:MAG: hypothetical protein J7K02_03565 [Deltaproteobacteria bacterium]|nr:hypothetical protein [Deltaproteobacteria bacterium]
MLENHVLWAWSEIMALPVIFLYYGVMEYWENSYRILCTQDPRQTGFMQRSGFTKPFCQSQTITPVLHCSTAPTTPGLGGWLLAPFQGGSKQSHVLWAWILYYHPVSSMEVRASTGGP